MERQQAPTLDGIRADHRFRYEFANQKLPPVIRVLDAACGCGYGSYILTDQDRDVVAVDAEYEAINYGLTRYPGPDYYKFDLNRLDPEFLASPLAGNSGFDAIVAFEIIEHLEDPVPVLEAFSMMSRVLIASVPNEESFPFDAAQYAGNKYPHRRHYTPAEFKRLLTDSGWKLRERYFQEGKQSPVMLGNSGRTIVCVADRA